MSGSSLDGVDIAYCEFTYDSTWQYHIIVAETYAYTEEWSIALASMPDQTGSKLVEFDLSYGKYLGRLLNVFINKHNLKPELISSHGHTVFHSPEKGFTFQLGNGQSIASSTGIKTISDFRIGDILLGGQGAPLVPIGDSLLFAKYDFCINIGGIANISFEADNKRVALDVCPANQLLNHLSRQSGKPYDENGDIAQLGKMDKQLFEELNNQSYYSLPYPKSMSNQLVSHTFISIIDSSDSSVQDKLYTVCKHIAFQINNTILGFKGDKVLITGGGAHNKFLITAIQKELMRTIIVPDELIVDNKEALIFALMGVLRNEGKVNCLASATGASRDSSSGVVYFP